MIIEVVFPSPLIVAAGAIFMFVLIKSLIELIP